MNVSSSTSASSTSSSGNGMANTIAKLQQQIEKLTIELKNLASSDMEAKAKMTQSTLLQNMIQMLQAQITAIQLQHAQEQMLKQGKSTSPEKLQAEPSAHKHTPRPGALVDTYA